MDSAWVSVIVGIGSSIITGAAWYGALRVWMTRREEREFVLREAVEDHEQRLRDLERRHLPPMDYAR